MAKTSTAVNKWDEKLAQYATEDSAKEVSGGSTFSFKSGILSFGGDAIPGNTVNVIVLGDVHENAYYSRPYDADNPVSPDCFAFSEDGKNMAPHPDSADPQSEKCATCPWNQFKSADNKKGKKCRNIRKIAVIPADQLEDVGAAELAFAKISPTNVENFKTHKKRVSDTLHRPLWATVSKMSCAPHMKKQVEVSFAYVDKITDSATLDALEARALTIQESLQVPYTYTAPEEAPAPAPAASTGKLKGRR